MDVRFGLLFLFLLGACDAKQLEATEGAVSDAPDSERDRLSYDQLAEGNKSRVAQTCASPSSQSGRIGSFSQAGRHGQGRGSTQPVPAIIEEVRPVVPTSTAAVETSAESTKAAATRSQLVGQKRPALEGDHSPNEPPEACPRVESSGASSSLEYTMPSNWWGLSLPVRDLPRPPQNSERGLRVESSSASSSLGYSMASNWRGLLLPVRDVPRPPQNSERGPRVESSNASLSLGYTIPPNSIGLLPSVRDVPHPPQNSESPLHNTENALAPGRPPVPIPDCQYQMFPDIGRNPDALQIILAQVIAALTNQIKEMWKGLEAAERVATKAVEEKVAAERVASKAVEEKVAAEHARIAAEEEAATKVKSLRAEHRRALSDRELEHDRALAMMRSWFSGYVSRLQQVVVSLGSEQARQEAAAGALEAMNEEPSAESQEAELVVFPPNEDVDEVAADGTQPVAEERFAECAGGEEGDAI